MVRDHDCMPRSRRHPRYETRRACTVEFVMIELMPPCECPVAACCHMLIAAHRADSLQDSRVGVWREAKEMSTGARQSESPIYPAVKGAEELEIQMGACTWHAAAPTDVYQLS